MLSTQTLLCLCAAITGIQSRSSGPPITTNPEICNTMQPNHGEAKPQETQAPFSISLPAQVTAGNVTTATVSSTTGGYMGIFLQMRKINCNGEQGDIVGQWLPRREFSAGNCNNGNTNVLFQKIAMINATMDFRFAAPAGRFVIRGTFVKNYSTFWTNVNSEITGTDQDCTTTSQAPEIPPMPPTLPEQPPVDTLPTTEGLVMPPAPNVPPGYTVPPPTEGPVMPPDPTNIPPGYTLAPSSSTNTTTNTTTETAIEPAASSLTTTSRATGQQHGCFLLISGVTLLSHSLGQ